MIIPALLEHNLDNLATKINVSLTMSEWIHIDFIDSAFSSHPNAHIINPSFFVPFAKKAKLELHMMVRHPESYVKAFSEAGFSRFIGHIEHMSKPQDFVARVHHNDKEAFLGVDYPTELDALTSLHINRLGLAGVLLMTVPAGKSGQGFKSDSLQRIKVLHTHFPSLPIEVDGGINEHTISEVKQAGASIFAVTSGIFNDANPHQAFSSLSSQVS